MADSYEGLMAAVLQAPREDAPRLRLADWLTARGDPRGEFIRVQVELARLDPATDEADRLARRERELLFRHEVEWIGPLAGWLAGWTFRRGFIEEATVNADTLVAHAEDIFRFTPIESLRIHEAGAVSDDLANCRHLARVSRLRFGSDDGDGEPLGDDGVAALARSPHLTRLEELTLGMEQTGASGLEALAEASWVKSLRSFGLTMTEVGDEALSRFLAAAPLTRLEVLNLDGTGAGAETTKTLAQSAAFGELRELILRSNEMGGAGLAALAATTRLPRLTVLDICGISLEAGDLKPLHGSPLLARLTGLEMYDNLGLEASDLGEFLASPSFPALTGLALGSVGFGDEGADIVARAAVLRGLKRLEFRSSKLSGAGVEALARSPHLTNLEALDLFSNKGASAAARAVASSPTLAGLRKLVMSNNEIADDGAQALAESPHLSGLRSLSLRANRLTANGVAALARSAHLGRLRSLDLSFMSLTDDAALALANSAPLANLASLVLPNNKIGGPGRGRWPRRRAWPSFRNWTCAATPWMPTARQRCVRSSAGASISAVDSAATRRGKHADEPGTRVGGDPGSAGPAVRRARAVALRNGAALLGGWARPARRHQRIPQRPAGSLAFHYLRLQRAVWQGQLRPGGKRLGLRAELSYMAAGR